MALNCAVSFGPASVSLPVPQMPDLCVEGGSMNTLADASYDSNSELVSNLELLIFNFDRLILGFWISLGGSLLRKDAHSPMKPSEYQFIIQMVMLKRIAVTANPKH